MKFTARAGAALVIGAVGIGLNPAQALVAVPPGVAVGAATDLLTIAGTYTALPPPLAQPFAVAGFSLSVIVPSEVSVAFPFGTLFGITTGNGSYSNDGVTETFSAQDAIFGSTGGSANNVTFEISNLLTTPDFFSLDAQTLGSLFTPTSSDGLETFNPGSYGISSGTASYAADPPFAGTVTIHASTAVPEPAGLGLFLSALAGMLVLRRGGSRQGSKTMSVEFEHAGFATQR